MTLVDIKNLLLSHFLNSSAFSFPNDLNSIVITEKEDGEEMVNNKEQIVRHGLDELCKVGIVSKINKELYILSSPLNQLNQTVVLSPMTTLMIADLVNEWTKKTGEMKETGYVVNKLSITDRDIAAVCHICHVMLSNDMDSDDKEMENDKN